MDRIEAANELAFRLRFSGHSGHLRLEPLPPVDRPNPLNSLPDFITPHVFPTETRETIKEYIEEKYLFPRLDADEFSAEKVGRQWGFDWFDRANVLLEPSLPRFVVVPTWELPFRRLQHESVQEKSDPNSVQMEVSKLMAGSQDFSPLPHMAGPVKDFVRGSINSRPFRPGGLDDTHSLERTLPAGASNGEWVRKVLDGGTAEAMPPSFRQGLDLGNLKECPYSWKVFKGQTLGKSTLVEKSALSLEFDDLFKKAWEEDVTESNEDVAESDEDVVAEFDEDVVAEFDEDVVAEFDEDVVAEFDEDVVAESDENVVAESDENVVAESDEDDESASAKLEVRVEKDKLDMASNINNTESLLFDGILSVQPELSMSRVDGVGNSSRQQEEPWAVTGGNEGIAYRFRELVPDMALDFPFELDEFQKEAIYYLEKGQSVFVAAHTSAGKTVVAEYAFALASKHFTRAVYTAPIKTISNQKYRDLCGKFDVGLLTGDVSLRPEASCLIMTTEILRSMLYRGADIIRDIEWVIFDEVHYVNDVERGVVWEEVIIMLPRHINVVLLSATVPNTFEFADWIGRTKQKKIRVTGTTRRPVPLEHCLFYSGELYKVCESEIFIPLGFKAAKDAYKKKNASTLGGGTRTYGAGSQNIRNFSGTGVGNQLNGGNQNNWGSRKSEASIWLLLINKLLKMSLLPVVIFCFSKNRCDKSADNLNGRDLTTSYEKSQIRVFCDKAFSRLKGSDRNLPQVLRVQSLLRRGIGVHHAGLLPIVKEVVEMLFCQGVIKVLFSTETFAMGVNAPARTVVFDSLRKFDGREFRQLLPGEYTQMAGRAGRRGIDKIGTVVVLCRDEFPEESDLKHVIVGSPTRLASQFRLTYIMILHLLRVEELKVEDMLKRSFAEFHAQKNLPEKQQLLMRKLAQPAKKIECIKGEPTIEEYYDMYTEAEKYSNQISAAVMQSSAARQFLTTGRVVVVRAPCAQDHLLGLVVKAPSVSNKQYIVLAIKPDLPSSKRTLSASDNGQDNKSANFQEGYFIVPKSRRHLDNEYNSFATSRKESGNVNIKLPYNGEASGVCFEVRETDSNDFLCICDHKLKIDRVQLLEDVSSAAYSKTIQKLLSLKSEGNKHPPALDPVKDLKLKDVALVEAYIKWNRLLEEMGKNKCHGCIKLEQHIKLAKDVKNHKEEVNSLKFQMSDKALLQMPDFQGRIDVLKEIGCIDTDHVVQIKGRVACEMNSGEELICTECLFENQLDDLEPEEAVALMSALVFQQKKSSEPSLTPKLSQAKQRLYSTAMKLGELQAKFNVQVIPEEYAQDNLKFGLVEVVYEWAKGTPFADICELTDVPEGMIVRTIVRLDETCREFRNAAAIMGNSALYKKMESASNAIKRDIVFAASLYITGV